MSGNKKTGQETWSSPKNVADGQVGLQKVKSLSLPTGCEGLRRTRHCMHPIFRPWLRGEGRCSLLSLRRGRCLVNRQTEGLQIRHMSRRRKSIFLRPHIKTCSASSGFLFAFGSLAMPPRVPARSTRLRFRSGVYSYDVNKRGSLDPARGPQFYKWRARSREIS